MEEIFIIQTGRSVPRESKVRCCSCNIIQGKDLLRHAHASVKGMCAPHTSPRNVPAMSYGQKVTTKKPPNSSRIRKLKTNKRLTTHTLIRLRRKFIPNPSQQCTLVVGRAGPTCQPPESFPFHISSQGYAGSSMGMRSSVVE